MTALERFMKERGCTVEDIKTITKLREKGLAVAVIYKDELQGMDSEVVESAMVQEGFEMVKYLLEE